MTNYIIREKIQKTIKEGVYSSLPANRARTNSLLVGSLIGLGITLPVEAIADRLERFNYDVVDPSIIRTISTIANTATTVTPTVRSATHAMVKYRYAIAHAPLTLLNPIESLTWALAANKVHLFKDSALEIFKDLGLSPQSIDLRRLFSTFADTSANVYLTVKQGLHGVKAQEATLRGTKVPLLSISEDQLAAIVPSFLGIVLGYVLPLPSSEVDDIHAYTMAQHSSSLYQHVDSLNESTIIDTEQALKIATAIYKLRYRMVYAQDTVAHNAVYSQLTTGTSFIPAELIAHVNEHLRDQIADDVRDILVKSKEQEEGLNGALIGNPDELYFCEAVDGQLEIPTGRAPTFGFYDSLIMDNIEKDMAEVYRLQGLYQDGIFNERDIIALESIHGRYYHLIPRNLEGVSIEQVRGELNKYRNCSISQEGAGALAMAAGVAALAAIATFIGLIFNWFSKSSREADKLDREIKQGMIEIDERTKEIGRQSIAMTQNFDKMQGSFNRYKNMKTDKTPVDDRFNRIAAAIKKYNPKSQCPTNAATDRAGMLKFFGANLLDPNKISAVMLTRSDNSEVPQIPRAFYKENTFKDLIAKISKFVDMNNDLLMMVPTLTDKAYIARIIKDLKDDGPLLKNRLKEQEGAQAELRVLTEGFTVTLTQDLGAVNTTDIMSLAAKGSFSEALQSVNIDEFLKEVKNAQAALKARTHEGLKAIDDAVKKGELDEKEAKKLSDYITQLLRITRSNLTTSTRYMGEYFRAYRRIANFVKEYNYILEQSITIASHTFVERTIAQIDANNGVSK